MVMLLFFSNLVLLEIELILLVIKIMIIVVLECVFWDDVNEFWCVIFSIFLMFVFFLEYLIVEIVGCILYNEEYWFRMNFFFELLLNEIM